MSPARSYSPRSATTGPGSPKTARFRPSPAPLLSPGHRASPAPWPGGSVDDERLELADGLGPGDDRALAGGEQHTYRLPVPGDELLAYLDTRGVSDGRWTLPPRLPQLRQLPAPPLLHRGVH